MPDVTQTPRQAVSTFLEIYNRSNQLKNLAPLIVGGDSENPAFEKLQPGYEKIRSPFAIWGEDFEERIDGDSAQVHVTLVAADFDWHVGMRWKETLQLRREKTKWGEVWRIAPGEPKTSWGASDNYLKRLTTFLAHPQQMLMLLTRQKSANHIKMLSLGVLTYLQEHEFIFDFKPGTFQQEILVYIGEDEEWVSPENAVEKAAQTFSFNENLLGRNYNQIADKDRIVMVYLGQKGKLDFRFDGFSVAGFVDGHVEFVTAEQAKTLRWTP